jgi:flagellar biosynthesis/type III secretory pathway protein FliH
MLSKIIEQTSGHREADLLPLERVNSDAQHTPKSLTADAHTLNQRIAELEQALVKTEASAYARGRREAEAEAHQRYSASMQSTADRLAQAVKQLADLRPRLCKEAEADLLRLGLAIAQRILHRELNIDPTALQALVKLSLDRLGRQEEIRVRVSPSLADPVRAILAKVSSRPINVNADSTLEAGALIFETTRGQLDASIHSQLDEIERGLIDHLENR